MLTDFAWLCGFVYLFLSAKVEHDSRITQHNYIEHLLTIFAQRMLKEMLFRLVLAIGLSYKVIGSLGLFWNANSSIRAKIGKLRPRSKCIPPVFFFSSPRSPHSTKHFQECSVDYLSTGLNAYILPLYIKTGILNKSHQKNFLTDLFSINQFYQSIHLSYRSQEE